MIISLFYKHVQGSPEKIAIVVDTQKLSYLELSQKVAAFSAALADLGVKKGNHIAIILNNSVEFIVTMLAAAHIGAVIVPLNTTLKSAALMKAIEATDATFAIASKYSLALILAEDSIKPCQCISLDENNDGIKTYAEAIANYANFKLEPVQLDGEESYIITMTSGSTGNPKPIVLSQNTKTTRANSARDCYKIDSTIISLAATPLYHSLAQRLVILPLLLGGTAVIMHYFTPKLWLETVALHKVTFAIPVSSQLASILTEFKQHTYDVSSLKTLVSSSALIATELKQSLIDTFKCEIHEIYGASEVGVVTNLAPADAKDKLGTVGKVLPGINVTIMDDADNILPTGHVGEIACKTNTAFSEYYKLPDATNKAMLGGYFHTGDLGSLDEKGYLTFRGRKKDIIITGGINVYPKDIEDALMESGVLAECAVIGVEDIRLGEAILAVIVPKDTANFNVRSLQKLCFKQLADYQQPRSYEIIDALPRNAMGKIAKSDLRAIFKDIDLTKDLRNIIKSDS